MAQLVVDEPSSAATYGDDAASAKEAEQMDVVLKAHVIQLRLLLTTWQSHFRSGGRYIKEATMEKMDRTICKTIFDLSVRDMKAREAIGRSPKVWEDLVSLFAKACPSLEMRSIWPARDQDDSEPEPGANSNMIVHNATSLLRDLQRLDNMLSIARNVLTAGEKVQNLAAQYGFDREVCGIVNLCIKITARGYDGDGPAADEDKWQAVINGFKRLLITTLQFLSNLVTLNERLKLMLWVELFDSNISNPYFNSQQAQDSLQDETEPEDLLNTALSNNDEPIETLAEVVAAKTPNNNKEQWEGYLTFTALMARSCRDILTENGVEAADEVAYEELRRRWDTMTKEQTMKWQHMYEAWPPRDRKKILDFHRGLEPNFLDRDDMPDFSQAMSSDRPPSPKLLSQSLSKQSLPLRSKSPLPSSPAATQSIGQPGLAQRGLFRPRAGEKFIPAPGGDAHIDTPYRDLFKPPPIADFDFKMSETAEDGSRKLEIGKIQLLERLERPSTDRSQAALTSDPNSAVNSPHSAEANSEHIQANNIPQNPTQKEDGIDDESVQAEEVDEELDEDDEDEPFDEDDLEEDDEEDDEESSEDDYAIPGEDGRGLLTDVPLILGPNEIEVLPMIIMSGIVAPEGDLVPGKQVTEKERNTLLSMYTIRCHLLLAQENGRNLLRELLIFVAAWDLRDEELYFKFMVKIMEAILVNGLMPFAYNAFKETKDIISPAQAVIMKLLTKIFSTRNGVLPAEDNQAKMSQARYDVQIVHHLFTEFRTVIVPQICALIFLQGQIGCGNANIEDFPLNLWDMERMYEGVYQYLEFFAILTDHEAWKQHMAEWEVSSELITLLRELEAAIPKRRIVYHSPPLAPQANVVPPSPLSDVGDAPLALPESPEMMPQDKASGPVPVSVERPFDVGSPSPGPYPGSGLSKDDFAAVDDQDIAPATNGGAYSGAPIHDEPADFEWRNLKKLCVLVLSSLVWKNERLQDQVRGFGGVPAILSCCRDDEHNPYIREHAIMCLRFLVEGNETNTAMIRALEDGRSVDSVEAEFSPDVRGWRPSLNHEQDEPPSRRSALGDQFGRLYVPAEVLDNNPYETYMDFQGKVGLRRRASSSPADYMDVPAHHTGSTSDRNPSNISIPPMARSMINAMRASFEASMESSSTLPRSTPSSAASTAALNGPESWPQALSSAGTANFDPFKLAGIAPEMANELINGGMAETFDKILREATAAAVAENKRAISPGGPGSLEDTLARGLPEWMQAIVKGANALSRQAQANKN